MHWSQGRLSPDWSMVSWQSRTLPGHRLHAYPRGTRSCMCCLCCQRVPGRYSLMSRCQVVISLAPSGKPSPATGKSCWPAGKSCWAAREILLAPRPSLTPPLCPPAHRMRIFCHRLCRRADLRARCETAETRVSSLWYVLWQAPSCKGEDDGERTALAASTSRVARVVYVKGKAER